jgi:uncharacterized protein (TIGR02611 family)
LITLKRAKKLIVITIGFTILIIGIMMIVLPGPAIIVIPAGLAILAGEFIWARNLLRMFKSRLKPRKQNKSLMLTGKKETVTQQ